ncbi:unnamed protein product, partial [Amoebophrya sp. A25]
ELVRLQDQEQSLQSRVQQAQIQSQHRHLQSGSAATAQLTAENLALLQQQVAAARGFTSGGQSGLGANTTSQHHQSVGGVPAVPVG